MGSRGVLDRPVKPGDDSFDCGGRLSKPQFLPRSNATKQYRDSHTAGGCFAEPVIGRRFAPTRWPAMTISTPYCAQAVTVPPLLRSPIYCSSAKAPTAIA